MKTVGQLLRERRNVLGLTLTTLSQRVDTAKSYLSMVENQRLAHPPSRKLLQKLEKALGLEPDELLRLAEWETTPARVRALVENLVEQARRGQQLAQILQQAADKGDKNWRDLDKASGGGELATLLKQTLQPSPSSMDHLIVTTSMRGRIPIVNRVADGYPRSLTDLNDLAGVAIDSLAVPGLSDPQAFATRVVGETMAPDYRENDLVVFSPSATVTDGCDCFVRLLPDHCSTFKRIFFDQPAQSDPNQTAPLPQRLRLQPINPRFAPQIVDREQVAGLYKAVFRLQPLD